MHRDNPRVVSKSTRHISLSCRHARKNRLRGWHLHSALLGLIREHAERQSIALLRPAYLQPVHTINGTQDMR